jgi:amino acid transporter
MTNSSGWLCFTGWQAAIGSIAFLVGNSIQGLIILQNPDSYSPKPWQGTLLVFAIVLSSIFFNTILASKMPLVEGIVFIVHVCGLIVIIGTLWALAPKKSADVVFRDFANNGGWSNMGTSFMVGLMPLAGSVSGIDCVMHMGKFFSICVIAVANKSVICS